MVRRVPVVSLAVLAALGLGGCSAPAPSPTPVAAVTSTAPPQFGDGDYLFHAEPASCVTPMDGAVLTVLHGVASIPVQGDVSMTGPVTVDSTTVSMGLTVPDFEGALLELDGVMGADGVVTGDGTNTGVPEFHCAFGFTLTPRAGATALADGVYVLHLAPDCPTTMEGRRITIAGGQATFPMASGYTMTGPVTLAAPDVSIRLDLEQPTKVTTRLDGVLHADGSVSGTGDNGGIHPGGETGYSCAFTFTMTPVAPAASAPTAAAGVDCSRDALQAAQDAVQSGEHRTVDSTGYVCSGEWAAAGLNGTQSQVTGVFRWEDGRWVAQPREQACGPAGVPADIAALACGTN